jgi:hypothetical protein
LISELTAFVQDWHSYFSANPMSTFSKLDLQTHDVDVLEKPEPERIVNLVERTNDRVRETLFNEYFRTHKLIIDAPVIGASSSIASARSAASAKIGVNLQA